MAKIRIYELARDLNMTNKMLLEKIRDMDIDVKSHMSSIDDETEARIRGKILGSPAKEVEETRIKPTLIRRRKKRVRPKPVEIETSAEPELRPEKIDVKDQTPEKILEEKELPPDRETKKPETAGLKKKSEKKPKLLTKLRQKQALSKKSLKPKNRSQKNLKNPLS